MLDVKGRWVLITGAARGIGHGAALFMAKKGANLILHGRKVRCHQSDLKALFKKVVRQVAHNPLGAALLEGTDVHGYMLFSCILRSQQVLLSPY